MSEPAILGLDNVRLELPIATVGSRTLAAIVDYFLLSMLLLVWLGGALAILARVGLSTGWTIAILSFGSFLLQWGYFAALEIAMDGRTPGKLLAGLRVVSHRGGRASAGAMLVRNLLRTLDVLVGLVLMAIDRRARRLGDFVAGTLVVHHRPEADETRLRRHPPGWGAREVAVAESFLRRADLLEPERAATLAGRLLDAIREREPAFWAEVEPELVQTPDRVLMLRQVLAEAGG